MEAISKTINPRSWQDVIITTIVPTQRFSSIPFGAVAKFKIHVANVDADADNFFVPERMHIKRI